VDPVVAVGRIEVPGVDRVVGVADPGSYPPGNFGRSRRNVCVAENGDLRHIRRIGGGPDRCPESDPDPDLDLDDDRSKVT
jgi:hypothetical protein